MANHMYLKETFEKGTESNYCTKLYVGMIDLLLFSIGVFIAKFNEGW